MKQTIIATSIAPFNIDTQYAATLSWSNAGFRVISVNSTEELNILKKHFPHVDFLETPRHAKMSFGKPYVYFDDILQALNQEEYTTVGIVNSDIHLLNIDENIHEFFEKETDGSLVYGSRIDVESIQALREGKPYRVGFDFFFFRRHLISVFPKSNFCLGLPWWDYWMLLIPLKNKIQLKKLFTPIAFHQIHSLNWNLQPWHKLSVEIAGALNRPVALNEYELKSLADDALDIIAEKSKPILYDHNRKSKQNESLYKEQGTKPLPKHIISLLVSQASENDQSVCCTFYFKDKIFRSRDHNIQAMIERLPIEVWEPVVENFMISKIQSQYNKLADVPRVISTVSVPIYFRDYLQRLLSSYKRKTIYIFGAGSHTTELFESGALEGYTVAGIIDSHPTRTQLKGLPIYSEEMIAELSPDIILISSYSFEQEIYNRLKEKMDESKLLKIYYK